MGNGAGSARSSKLINRGTMYYEVHRNTANKPSNKAGLWVGEVQQQLELGLYPPKFLTVSEHRPFSDF